eukprot:6329406-Amphidinium_carterae.1
MQSWRQGAKQTKPNKHDYLTDGIHGGLHGQSDIADVFAGMRKRCWPQIRMLRVSSTQVRPDLERNPHHPSCRTNSTTGIKRGGIKWSKMC